MLFSQKDDSWKLADFGTASKATSKRLNTTRYSRGTASYRSPEVLNYNARYNNKADIFALGCIIYEIITGSKLFQSDWAVCEYSLQGHLAMMWPHSDQGSVLGSLGTLVSSMLEKDPFERPNALRAKERLLSIRDGLATPELAETKPGLGMYQVHD